METRKLEKTKKFSKAQLHIQNHAAKIIKYLSDTVTSRKLAHIGKCFDGAQERLFFNSKDIDLENIFTQADLVKSFEKRFDKWKNKISVDNIQVAIDEIVDYYFAPIATSPAWEEFLKQQKIPENERESALAKIKGAFAYKIQSAAFTKNSVKFSESKTKSKIINLTLIYSSFTQPANVIKDQQEKLKTAIKNKLLHLVRLTTLPDIVKNIDKWKSSIKKEGIYATLPEHNEQVLEDQMRNILLLVIETKLDALFIEIKHNQCKPDDRKVIELITSIRDENAVLVGKYDALSRINELYIKLQFMVNELAKTNSNNAKILASVILDDIDVYAKSAGKQISLAIVKIADRLITKYSKDNKAYPNLMPAVESLRDEESKIEAIKVGAKLDENKTEMLDAEKPVQHHMPRRLQDSPIVGRKIVARYSNKANLFQDPLRGSISLTKEASQQFVVTETSTIEMEYSTPEEETPSLRSSIQHTLSATRLKPALNASNLRRGTSVDDSASIFALGRKIDIADDSSRDIDNVQTPKKPSMS